jgi:hypothetical protein
MHFAYFALRFVKYLTLYDSVSVPLGAGGAC